MPTPALGRTVHTFVDPALNNGSNVAAAMIVRVWSESLVNLRVFVDGKSDVLSMTSVGLYADQDAAVQAPTYTTASDGSRLPAAAFWPPIN